MPGKRNNSDHWQNKKQKHYLFHQNFTLTFHILIWVIPELNVIQINRNSKCLIIQIDN